MSRLKDIPVAALVEDFSLYPRHAIDRSHVRNLRLAYEAGHTTPPPVVDKENRIIDGWHRVRASRQAFGDDAAIQCEVRDYKTRADALRDAISLNASHARKFDEQDRTRCVILLSEEGVKPEEIAATLHTTVERVQKLSVRIVEVAGEKREVKPLVYEADNGKRKLTKAQYEVAAGASGWRTSQTVTQLANEIEAGLIQPDEKLTPKLRRLHELLDELLAAV